MRGVAHIAPLIFGIVFAVGGGSLGATMDGGPPWGLMGVKIFFQKSSGIYAIPEPFRTSGPSSTPARNLAPSVRPPWPSQNQALP